ncbi:enoyl-CoA hydratase-related protein [Streptomyces turgidiscabies]|uniref:Enoyl-CoA hydratase/isomerase family protein n=1 Tax=Streptomyces turgidiscabies (strain Car8) TaxID=698760 RepID=L7FF45_STRT8|nr:MULTISPECIES: enoyl-CoA hydratase-related protein [Streptomyces]ELP69932.1 enoyl-CoA hydratase/isomerase family protein [Streptomyces turgidiscabies Car8]MDX3499078.1 enoyl-CoA hydratase-related protein [Streptomyces turgidiscabies]GAQ73527.1 putative enoyl-CoA hydratase echA8 [Streptomyces turgidiscabies]
MRKTEQSDPADQPKQPDQEDLVLTERVGNVLVATMNRPEARNALNPELLHELSSVLKEADAAPAVRAIVLTGAGPVFCAGMDLKAFARGARFDSLLWFYREGVATPVVAALNGSAVAGGFELALACDLVVAADHASLGIAEVKRGLFAAGGATTLADRIPLAVALEMGLTGELVTASRAADIGLVNRVVPADAVRAEALALAERIAQNGPLGVAMTKKLMRSRRWAKPAEIEAVFRSADATEGARAFAERRAPVWTGK